MQKYYLVPVEQFQNYRGPEYFAWRFDQNPPSITCKWGAMDYGFVPYMLLYAADIDEDVNGDPIPGSPDHTFLLAQPDVYAFPDNLDAPVADPNIDTFFEGISLPTDWLTPSTTYRELLRNTAGMFQFNQRYGGIYAERYGGLHSIFDTATLDTRLREMTVQEQEIFLATVESFGVDSTLVNTNSQLRLLVRQAANVWENTPFYLLGVEF